MIKTIGEPEKVRIVTIIKSSDLSSGVQEGDAFVNTGIWEELYQSLQKPPLDPVFTGFNANIDRIIPLTSDLLRSLEKHALPGFDTILSRLKQSMRYSSADEVFINEPSVYDELSEFFSRSGTLSVGGQAGIAAVHLHRFGVPSIICAAGSAGPEIYTRLKNAGVTPLTFDQESKKHPDLIHLVFEYTPDPESLADRVVPRKNRFIVSPVHDSSTVIIPDTSVNSFLEQIRPCRRAFLSGYQYLRTEQEFETAAMQIHMIRSVHPLMRTHVECVSGADPGVMLMIFHHILPKTDSIGLNERELGGFMQVLEDGNQTPATPAHSTPVACIHNAIALADATGVRRIHLHTFGYYILVLKSDTVNSESSRNALLLAARVTANSAGLGEQILSREGLRAYADVREMFGPDETPGVFRIDDRVVILVPTFISQTVQKTTGLGDILSSTAFVADQF